MSRNVTAKAHRPGPQARGRSALARMLARRPHLLSRTPATHSCHALLSRPTDHERCIGRSAVDICRVTTVHPAPTRVTRPRLSALRSQPQTSEPHSSLKPEGPSPAAPARPPARRAMRPDIQRLKRRSAPRQASSSRRIPDARRVTSTKRNRTPMVQSAAMESGMPCNLSDASSKATKLMIIIIIIIIDSKLRLP